MPTAHDRFGKIRDTSVQVTLQKPGEEPVKVNLKKGFTPPENTDPDTKSDETKPDER